MGDLQIGEDGFRKDLWQEWKRDAIADPTSLIIGMGDYSDRFRTSVDHKIRHALLDDNSSYSEFDYLMMKETQEIAKELEPFKHRIIGLHEGHHFHTMQSGTTTTQYLCQLLGVKYLDFVAVTSLSIGMGKARHVVDIFSTHGCGGASNTATDLRNLESRIMPYWDCDIFLRGHSTRAYTFYSNPVTRVCKSYGGEISLTEKQKLGVNTGGFMEAYKDGTSSNYVERANMPKVQLGWCVINLHLTNPRKPNGQRANVLKISAQTVVR